MIAAPSAPIQIEPLIQAQRQFFASGQTRSRDFRMTQLETLKNAIQTHQDAINDALKKDLNKPQFESVASEIIYGLEEIQGAMKNLRQWMQPRRVGTPLSTWPSSGKIIPEPLGVVLIIGPWNYPFQLLIAPLIGAIAAGNCAILKPSELAPETSKIAAQIITEIFPPDYVTVVEGGKAEAQALLAQKFDHIFFTGGTAIGKIVMQAAAQHLTPVTLELGGKSPCIIEPDTHLDYTARRIAWGKFINAGQTCIAPDYLLVQESIKTPLLTKIQAYVQDAYGEDPAQSEDYCRIITEHHFDRLSALIDPEKVIFGGQTNREERYIAPTILDAVTWDDPVMQDEIFGPILPILTYTHLDDAIAQINARPKPLALYLFAKNQQTQNRVLQETSSGGVCLNDTIMHVGCSGLPFGGVGDSGIGAYHGKASFDTFSHYKSVLSRSFLFDLKLRYPPYEGKLKWVKMLLS